MLQTGQRAPTFDLPGAGGGRIDTHDLTEYTENGWAVVLVFYPFDFHPSCTTRMCTLRDSEALSLVEDTVVLGISIDSAYSHREFAKKHRIDYPLLSDSDGQVAEAYGVRAEEIDDHRGVAQSALFVIDPDRRIQYAWRSQTVDGEPDLSAVEHAAHCHGEECRLPDGKSYL